MVASSSNLSRPAVQRRYHERSGVARGLAEIAKRRRDPHARETLDELYRWFGRALSVVVDVLDPDVVVVGGGVSNLEGLYGAGVRELPAWVFNDELRTRVVCNTLGDSAGVLGAALIAPST